eukprot:4170174-Pyramimonas_sp.AAC.1
MRLPVLRSSRILAPRSGFRHKSRHGTNGRTYLLVPPMLARNTSVSGDMRARQTRGSPLH